MKGAHAEVASRIRRSPELDLPRVLVAAATTDASRTIARTLRDAGYIVRTTLAGTGVLRDLRDQETIELRTKIVPAVPEVELDLAG